MENLQNGGLSAFLSQWVKYVLFKLCKTLKPSSLCLVEIREIVMNDAWSCIIVGKKGRWSCDFRYIYPQYAEFCLFTLYRNELKRTRKTKQTDYWIASGKSKGQKRYLTYQNMQGFHEDCWSCTRRPEQSVLFWRILGTLSGEGNKLLMYENPTVKSRMFGFNVRI